MFRNKYKDSPKRVNAVTGEKIVDTYVLDTESNTLLFAGKENIYDYIQSFKDSTDINIILKQLEVGDDSKLHARKGVYIDVSHMPSNASELHKASIIARTKYESLPEELRQKFGTFDEFIDADSNFIHTVLDDYNAKLSVQDNGDINVSEDTNKEV